MHDHDMLSQGQEETFLAAAEYYSANGRLPNGRQIAEILKQSPKTHQDNLQTLITKGVFRAEPGSTRCCFINAPAAVPIFLAGNARLTGYGFVNRPSPFKGFAIAKNRSKIGDAIIYEEREPAPDEPCQYMVVVTKGRESRVSRYEDDIRKWLPMLDTPDQAYIRVGVIAPDVKFII